jgi:hypothetical protein
VRDVDVRAPVAGEILVGNTVGVWEPQVLGVIAGSFGTPAPLTAALTTLTTVAPGTPDYAIQDVVSLTPFGFVTAEEARTVLSVLTNLQVRLAEVEAQLVTLGIMA